MFIVTEKRIQNVAIFNSVVQPSSLRLIEASYSVHSKIAQKNITGYPEIKKREPGRRFEYRQRFELSVKGFRRPRSIVSRLKILYSILFLNRTKLIIQGPKYAQVKTYVKTWII